MSDLKNIRALVVLPMYGGSLPIGRYCASALKSLGHTVEIFEAPDFHPAFDALRTLRVTSDRLEHLENSFLQVVSNAVAAKVETFEPDLVLAMAQAPLSRQTLKRLRRDGVVTAMWFVEDFRLFTYWEAFAPLYDIFAVIQKDPFSEKLRQIGQENALYLPLAADSAFHRPLKLSPVDQRKYGADLSFLGAGYVNRRLAFRRLLDFDLKIWGSDWDGDEALSGRVQLGGRRITPEEAVKIFNATAVNLNLHSSVNPGKMVAGGDFVNPRTFELAMCGAFQLVDDRSLLPELFAPGELAVFKDMDDLIVKIRHYLEHPDERAAIAEKARNRALAEHGYASRMETLLEFTAGRIAGWPKARPESEAMAALPPELRGQVGELLADLSLPSDASFDDLVWTLRARQGALSGLEAAILFLDEWRKQYAGGQT